MQALYEASRNKDLKRIAVIIGLPEDDLVTDDEARNAERAQFFAKRHDEFVNVVRDEDGRARIFIGTDNYPLAAPLVRRDGRWFFDSAGGKEALRARVIEDNELATVGVCRAYLIGQYEYYAEDRDGDEVLEYAQRLGSTAGQRDGLYWEAQGDEPECPLGPLIAQARAEGHLQGSAERLDQARPYHGYVFKVLARQGENAPGGKYDYVLNNNMVAGFGLLAYPARWNRTGRMTFMVGANGRVFQKDLGEDTPRAAGLIDSYNPDETWQPVRDEATASR